MIIKNMIKFCITFLNILSRPENKYGEISALKNNYCRYSGHDIYTYIPNRHQQPSQFCHVRLPVRPYENVDRGDYETNMKKCQNIKYIYYPHSHFTIKVANLSFKFQPKRITNTEEYKGSSSWPERKALVSLYVSYVWEWFSNRLHKVCAKFGNSHE